MKTVIWELSLAPPARWPTTPEMSDVWYAHQSSLKLGVLAWTLLGSTIYPVAGEQLRTTKLLTVMC